MDPRHVWSRETWAPAKGGPHLGYITELLLVIITVIITLQNWAPNYFGNLLGQHSIANHAATRLVLLRTGEASRLLASRPRMGVWRSRPGRASWLLR